MVSFDIKVELLETSALRLEFFKVPWDSEILSRPTAQIRVVDVRDPDRSFQDIQAFLRWKIDNEIAFCSVRIPHADYASSMLLQAHSYRFIELNYRPGVDLERTQFPPDKRFCFSFAEMSDKVVLEEMAAMVFTSGRFHFDRQIGTRLAGVRYGQWMQNAFHLPHQKVVICKHEGNIAAFFVVEFPSEQHCFWSLVGLAPSFVGKSLGKHVWRSMLSWQHSQGVTKVSTSISSLNSAILNLYGQLGFSFPTPEMTLHWHASPAISH